MTDTTPAPTVQAARVTIDDVRTILEGTDPNQTNASKVRTLLGGRGSFETIQKHLNTLRQELATAAMPPVAADQVPAMPTEVANQMWSAAFSAAQVATMVRSEKLAAERDAALLKLEAMGQDVAGLVFTVDEQAGQLDQAAQEVAKIQAAHIADSEKAKADQAAAAAELERVKTDLERVTRESAAELERVKAAAAAAAAIAQRDAQIAAAAMQTTIDNLNAQVHQRDLLLAQVHAPKG